VLRPDRPDGAHPVDAWERAAAVSLPWVGAGRRGSAFCDHECVLTVIGE
jgi:hypothetical protein